MAEPYLAEIRLMSFAFPPKGWAPCDGRLLPINQNQALFSLLGTTYGGDGRVNFALPDLRGRTPLHEGGGHTTGEVGGAQAHALAVAEMAQHAHGVAASTRSTHGASDPADRYLGAARNVYRSPGSGTQTTLRADAVAETGAGEPHPNMQPFLVLSFCIALEGVYPSRN